MNEISDKDFYILFKAALDEDDPILYAQKWKESNIFAIDEPNEDDSAAEMVLDTIYRMAHISIRQIRQHLGLTQQAFSDKFCIPVRNIQHWEENTRKCPPYMRLALARVAGM